MGLLEVLTIIFVVLKLIGVITWSWWLVFSPVMLSVVIYVVVVVIYGVFLGGINRKIRKDDEDFWK